MNVLDWVPYMGGVIPGVKSPGNLTIDPRALLIGGMMPGILNQSTGGSPNLNTPMPVNIPGLLNISDGGSNTSPGNNFNLYKLLMSNYFGNM